MKILRRHFKTRVLHHIEQKAQRRRRSFQPTVRGLIQIARPRFQRIKQRTAGTRRRREKMARSYRSDSPASSRLESHSELFWDFETSVISKLDFEMTVISKRVISKRQPQGIVKPAALRAFLTSFYSFSFSRILCMPCGTALSAVASEPFLSHLRRG